MKNMTQVEFDNYLTTELLPDLREEYGSFDTLILNNNKMQFARACPKCGDLILLGNKHQLCKELANIDLDMKVKYLEILAETEVIADNQFLECECYEDEEFGDSEDFDDYDKDDQDDQDPYDTDIDLDEDYGDGNYEY